MYKPVVDFSRNPTKVQENFFRRGIGSAKGINPYRHLFYGGGIRGGKSFVCLALLVYLSKIFPNSRWVIYRKDFPALESTTIPSLGKIINGHPDWSWSKNRSNFFAQHSNGSRIFFKGENIDRDPELNDMLGLEINGIFYEQIEELSKKLWDMGQTRLGSWYCDDDPNHANDPKPITLATFNPTQEWIKREVYEPWRNGTLPPTFFYQNALPTDNGFISQDQWENWNNLPERYRLQMIQGDWTDFSDKNGLWAFSFDRSKHVKPAKEFPEMKLGEICYLSFDFNRNPICCSVIQHINGQIRVHETIKLANSDIYKLCTHINARYGNFMFRITGDASGNNSSAMVKDNINYYTIIQKELRVSSKQIDVPTQNPRLEENQVLVNALLEKGNIIIHEEKAAGLVYDLGNVRMDKDKKIEKSNRQDEAQQADALDTFRYYLNQYHSGFIKYGY